MKNRNITSVVAIIMPLILVLLPCTLAQAEVAFEASWEITTYDQARKQILSWIDTAGLEEQTEFEARSLWPAGNLRASDGTALLERVVETFALADPRAKQLVQACNIEREGPLLPEVEWLEDETLASFFRQNLRLYYARWLAQHELYDEVLAVLAKINLQEVVDPAGLLFYQMIAAHQLVMPDESRLVLEVLLEQEEQLPHRYLKVAQLLRHDLSSLKDESLDHVARRMNDVRRRLDHGRAGKQVQVVEKGVIDSLDQMIKKLEESQKQSSGQSISNQQSSKPMQDSQLQSAKAPMQVDQRDVGNQSGWGDLPEKEREQALQQIGREYPAHYRELIEQYFRELADETSRNPTR